jgi:hypothetical protein
MSSTDSLWIQSRDGHAIDLIKPDLSLLTIEEVAHSLARINRFSGHTRTPRGYSVAQHSCLVSEHLPPDLQFEGLMHDAHESIIGDISSPVKWALEHLGGGAALDELDDIAMIAVAARWPDPKRSMPIGKTHPLVKEQDMRACVTERRDLMGDVQAKPWKVPAEPWPEKIVAWSVDDAEDSFLHIFRQLYEGD